MLIPLTKYLPLLLSQWLPACLSCRGEENIPKNACSCPTHALLPFQPRPLLTNAGDALHRDLPHSLLEAAEPRVDLADLGLLAFNQFLDDLRKQGSEGPTRVQSSRKARVSKWQHVDFS